MLHRIREAMKRKPLARLLCRATLAEFDFRFSTCKGTDKERMSMPIGPDLWAKAEVPGTHAGVAGYRSDR